jgi:hypothetical protein
LRVHPQLSHNGYLVDGVLVDAGSLWPQRVREKKNTHTHTHSLPLHILGLWVSEELTTPSNGVGRWVGRWVGELTTPVQSRVSSDSK